jgi:hypothetical protein
MSADSTRNGCDRPGSQGLSSTADIDIDPGATVSPTTQSTVQVVYTNGTMAQATFHGMSASTPYLPDGAMVLASPERLPVVPRRPNQGTKPPTDRAIEEFAGSPTGGFGSRDGYLADSFGITSESEPASVRRLPFRSGQMPHGLLGACLAWSLNSADWGGDPIAPGIDLSAARRSGSESRRYHAVTITRG